VDESPEKQINPEVDAKHEFTEIVNDFSDSFEIFREGISNAFDHGASEMRIAIDVEEIAGYPRVVITLADNGNGMTEEILSRDFWGLGFSTSRGRDDAIGNKGHGTKIYLRSQKVEVRTQCKGGAFSSVCIEPFSALKQGRLHSPSLKAIPHFKEGTGTEIRVEGYNDNERSRYYYDIVRDYMLWRTKLGSIEKEFGVNAHTEFKLFLKCLDTDGQFRQIPFGHVFPPENSDIQSLYSEHDVDAHDFYVKRYSWANCRLRKFPEVKYEVVIYVEGDKAKRLYNKMIRDRARSDTGKYKVADQYGLWLCRDYIPINRCNDWLSGFGSGSNSYVMLHGFVNCQTFKLTANRGAVSNSNPTVLEELRIEVSDYISQIDTDLRRGDIYTLREWQEETRTEKQEKADFEARVKNIKGRKSYEIDGVRLLVPVAESELFGFFISLYNLRPSWFDFEPLDYNTTRGIDIVARNKSGDGITITEFGYVELKQIFRSPMNHSFKHLSRIVCWDFAKETQVGTDFHDISQKDTRRLGKELIDGEPPVYYLDAPKRSKIEVIRLAEFLDLKLKQEEAPRNHN